MELREKIGQMIMTGYPSGQITPELMELIETYQIGNIILFSYNLQSMDQIRSTCRELHERIEESTGHPAFIAVDQEGGVVTRLPEEADNVPGAMLLGAAGKKEYAYEAGVITGTQLKALGINLNLAPVLDVNSNPDNPVIGVRSYSDDPLKVEEFGTAMMRGLLKAGVMATVKHFPGHGDTAVDSHLGLPVIDRDIRALWNQELIPFIGAIRQGAPCVMTSHILFPKLEKEKKPATMSKAVLTGLLRETLGFEGIIITDCLEMSAIQDHYTTAQGAVEAVKAGAQILCVSHTPKLVKETVRKIEEAVRSGDIPMEQIDKAAENILKYKEKYRIRYPENMLLRTARPEYKEKIEEMLLAGITKVTKGELPDITKDTVFLGSYAYRSTMASNATDKGLHFAKYLSGKFHCRYLDIPVEPGNEEIAKVLCELEGCSCVVYGMYNGHLNKGQVYLANEICRKGYKIAAVTLRNPYDLGLLDPAVHKIAVYEYNRGVFDALIKILDKTVKPAGILPVSLKKEETGAGSLKQPEEDDSGKVCNRSGRRRNKDRSNDIGYQPKARGQLYNRFH